MKIFKISSFIALVVIFFASCQKEYSLEGAGITGAAGTWQFNDSSKLYIGTMDTAFITTSGTTKTLQLIGRTANGQQVFNLNLYATDSITKTTYKASLSQTDFQHYTLAKTIYEANAFIGEFTVIVTVLGNNTISGTFSGSALDSAGIIKNITLGKFTSKVDLSNNVTGGGSGTSVGTLGVTAGACTPFSPGGVYIQGVPLTASNTVTVQATISTPGTYTISTNTVNGVTFSGSGTFSSAGAQSIVLAGSGTPVNSGLQTYTVTYGSSTCTFPITFGAGMPPSNSLVCSSVVVNGTYAQGSTLTAANTVQVQVNVVSTGAYTISTNTANGISFSNSGNFTTTGTQTVTLSGTGTPINSVNQIYTLTLGTSTCNFSIAFASTGAVDYFPRTANSHWTYEFDDDATDTILIVAQQNTVTIQARVYNVFLQTDNAPSGYDTSGYYRKSGSDYYSFLDIGTFFGLDNANYGEYIFIKDNITANTGYTSPSFSGTFGGIPISVRISDTLKQKDVTITVNNVAFTNTLVIKEVYQYFDGTNWVTIPDFYLINYYSRNIGLIKSEAFDDTNTSIGKLELGRYHVF